MRLFLPAHEAVAAGPGRVGGKAWNLARLTRWGFPAPRMCALTAALYREILARPEVQRPVRSLAGAGAEGALSPEIARWLEEAAHAITDAAWPRRAIEELEAALADARLADVAVAVRSSATAEDAPGTSFAGIHGSATDVTGADAVREAIARCWASLWTPRALAYRRRAKLEDEAVGCAVLICEMVREADGAPPQAAGVAFTYDPLSGRRDRVVVGAAKGLATDVVAGRERALESVMSIRGHHIRVVSHDDASPLSASQIEQLTRLALRVHWAFGDGQDPQDVEWVLARGRFWIVQARPATRLADPRPPALHDVRTCWSNANVKEALPDPVSTMGWSLVQRAVDRAQFLALRRAGLGVPSGLPAVRRFDGRVYFDATLLQWLHHDGLGLGPEDLRALMGGALPAFALVPLRPRTLRLRARWLRRRATLLLAMASAERRHARAIARHLGIVRAVADRDPASLDRDRIHERVQQLDRATEQFEPHFRLVSALSGLWFRLLCAVLRRACGDVAREVAGGLMASSGRVTTARIAQGVRALAAVARGDPEAQRLLEQPDADGWRRLPARSPFRAALERFLDEQGHRAVHEADIANPRWSDDPSFVLEQVRVTLTAPDDGGDGAGDEVRASAEARVDALGWLSRRAVRWVAERARRAARMREAARSALTATLRPSRRLIREVGRRLVEAGQLAEPDDVWELSSADLSAWLHGEWDGRGARVLVEDRQERLERWRHEEPPDAFVVIGSRRAPPEEAGQPRAAADDDAEGKPAGDGWLEGTPLSSGVARGIARCIRHPDEGADLTRDDVLVAPSIEPAWTPLFLRVCAVVVETGGYLSHGGIVAREYGLPAVSNIDRLFEKVRDGEPVTVDGGRGRVRPGRR